MRTAYGYRELKLGLLALMILMKKYMYSRMELIFGKVVFLSFSKYNVTIVFVTLKLFLINYFHINKICDDLFLFLINYREYY